MKEPKISDAFPIVLILIGVAFNLIYFFFEAFYEILLVIAPLILFILFIPFSILIVYGLFQLKKNPVFFKLSIASILITAFVHFYNPDWFRAPVIFKAKLVDDISAVDLTIYKSGKCVSNAHNAFGFSNEYWGECSIDGDKIIFLKDPYDINSFYPDTAFIIKNKMISRFHDNGEPDTTFASFFRITKNTSSSPQGVQAD